MKIVHLNTHSYGGAAVVARRLHRAALAAGIESQLITRYGVPDAATPGYSALQDARWRYLLREKAAAPQVYRLGKFVQRRLQHKNLMNRPAQFEIFSPLNTQRKFSDCTDRFDPAIIHLHWVAGFVDHGDFFARNVGKKFVWTLHDMNPFTGGCHHADGCVAYQSGCAQCPQLSGTIDVSYAGRVLADKTGALDVLADDQLTIVAPSKWLLELAQQSPVTRRFRHVQIANPTLAAQPLADDRDQLKHELGLPPDKKIVLFISDNLRNPRKGIDLLWQAARLMPRLRAVHFVGIGNRTDAPKELSISFPGRVTDERTLARYLACADVLVSPSVMENAPLTVIEALSCGTPAVAFNVGGVSELIPESCGTVVAERTPAALAAALGAVLFERSFDRSAIKQHAQAHAPAAVWAQYQSVYTHLLAS
jgi:glycosyltransferase involved in cell wall biosynthesis